MSHTKPYPARRSNHYRKEWHHDATSANTANFLLSNGLQVVSVLKIGQPNTLVLNTTIQKAISYTLTMLNLTSTEGASLVGVLQVTFTGLPSPAITSIDWRNPADGTALPGTLGTISLCTLGTGSGASCTSAPFYTKSALHGIVTGAYAVSYSYKIDAGSWSAEIPIATPLTVSGLSEGYHTVYVIGKHANGYWQATNASDVYTKSYVQDTVAPDTYIDPLTFPASVTASLSFNVRVIGTDVSYFRYCLDNGAINDCTTNTWRGGPDIASLGYAVPNAATVYTGNLVPGAVTIKVIGYDASGNALAAPISGGTYSYIVDTGTVEAVFNATDIAAITTTGTSASVRITNTNGAVAYRGKIVSGTDCNSGTAWNALPELPLSTPITATGLTGDGSYVTVCAIGKSLAGNWQGGWTTASATASIVTKYTWTIDTTAPTAALNWITPVSQPTTTTQTNYELQVSTSGGVTHYKYALATGAGASCASASYGAETPVSTSIQLSPLSTPAIATTGVTVYKVCVVARDAAGNYQAVASATATPEWTVDVDPPANNPSFAAASQSPRSFNIAVMQFDIDNSTATSDTEYYRIQVAKDVAFTQIVSDVNVKSCKNISLPECPAALATRTYSIAVDAYTSGSVYACVLAGDGYGNYRTDSCVTPPAKVYVSAEHYVVGKITGTVKNTAGSALAGISVRMYDSDGTPLNTQYADQVTDAAGTFAFSNVHTARNRYRVAAAFSDASYRPAAKRSISVQEVGSGGTVSTNIGTLNLVPLAATTSQNIVARVIDADDGWMLGYANVKLVDWRNTVGSAQRTVYTSNAAYADATARRRSGLPKQNIPKNISSGSSICGDLAFSSVAGNVFHRSNRHKLGVRQPDV
ncbi:MAG: carboxypeptidase-like regulatory domain-containing protein [Turneriella sp.]